MFTFIMKYSIPAPTQKHTGTTYINILDVDTVAFSAIERVDNPQPLRLYRVATRLLPVRRKVGTTTKGVEAQIEADSLFSPPASCTVQEEEGEDLIIIFSLLLLKRRGVVVIISNSTIFSLSLAAI